jgi:hypothetical protein
MPILCLPLALAALLLHHSLKCRWRVLADELGMLVDWIRTDYLGRWSTGRACRGPFLCFVELIVGVVDEGVRQIEVKGAKNEASVSE